MPRFLFTVPHYFSQPDGRMWHGSSSGNVNWRAQVLRETVLALHQNFGLSQCVMQLKRRESAAANGAIRGQVRVVICTTGGKHLIEAASFPAGAIEHVVCDVPPTQLGYACHRVMHERIEQADWFAYLEDDLCLRDSLFFQKLLWFGQLAGDTALLLPNRYEIGDNPRVHRAYVDGDLRDQVTARWQDRSVDPEIRSQVFAHPLRFVRPANPHAGCFFLRRDQLEHWASMPFFLDRSAAFIGPLESAATLGIMRAFRVYKPAIENAGFLEIRHQSKQFIRQLRPRKQ